MKCPDCGFENVSGSDECRGCGISLSHFDPQGTEMEQSIASHPINLLCQHPPICVTPQTSVREAVAAMCAKNLGCVLVSEPDGRLVGVFTERDILNKVAGEPDRLDCPVSDLMTTAPVIAKGDDSIAFALQAMAVGGYRHLPIVNAARVAVGIVSTRDILRFLCVRYARSRE
ncbi:MAG: cyclic nucleotide-binding/CBS domain-containing protein [Planctomycetales bacterium]